MAKKHLVVFLAVAFSVATLASAILPKNQVQSLKEKLVRNPNDFKAHLQLAQKFLANNQLPEAEQTLLLAQKIFNHEVTSSAYFQFSIFNSENKVLGAKASNELNELWQEKQYSDPEDIRLLITAWEKIMVEKPDYRDGWLQLAILHYKLYKNDKAKENLLKALEIDPNYAPAQELEKILGE